jgi:hypothetical protein
VPHPNARLSIGVLAVFWLLVAGTIAFRLQGRAVDDVFITYRYAQNLASGHGFVFNPGERVFGVTEPAVGLLLGAVAWATGAPIPLLGSAFTALVLLALAAALLVEGSSRGATLEGACAGTLVLATGLHWSTQGAAAPAVLLLLMSAARCVAGRPILAGILGALAVAFRPDALVGVGILGLVHWRQRRRLPWRFAVTGMLAIGAVAMLAWLWFGAVVPQTLLAKQYHAARNPGSWIGYANFWGFALDGLIRSAGRFGIAVPWALALGLLGALLALRRATLAEKVVALDGLTLLVIYPLLRVPFFGWYAIPPLVAALWGLAQTAGPLRHWKEAAGRAGAARAVAGALAALLCAVWLAGFVEWARRERPEWRWIVYREAGEWLRTHAAPDADVAFHEVGTLAFSSQRRVEDLLGLVTPRSLPYAREGDVVGAFLAKPTRYFVAHPFADGGAIRAIATRDWFRDGYREVARFDHRELGGWMVIFERQPGALLPPPAPPRPFLRLPLARPAS